jgi:hypothetical protein
LVIEHSDTKSKEDHDTAKKNRNPQAPNLTSNVLRQVEVPLPFEQYPEESKEFLKGNT